MRRILVTLHRWIGMGLALYVVLICVTGSALVYRPELLRHFEPQPVAVAQGPRLLPDAELLAAAQRAFPDDELGSLYRGVKPNHAVEIELLDGAAVRGYLFNPYTGGAIAPALPLGFRAVTFVLRLHTELLGGEDGRALNGALGLGLAFLALSGVLAWRPRGRQRAGSLRRLHMTVGMFAALFVLMWAVTGYTLAYPQVLAGVVDWFEPFDEENPVERVGDVVSYWLAYLHFGRFGGRFTACGRESLCDDALKIVWLVVALLPVFLAGSGVWLWIRGLRGRARVKQKASSVVQPARS